MTADEVLEREYLKARAKILELAAIRDRIDRASGDVAGDPRCGLLVQGLKTLLDDRVDRAAQVQMIFSREYAENWRSELDV